MPLQSPNSIIPTFSIHLLGSFQLQLNGQTLPLRHSRKEQWLLALLVLRQGRVLERDWLADTLWPDSLHSRVLLRDTLYDLRQTLGSQAQRLNSPTKQTLQLDLAGTDVDVIAYDEALMRGDTLSLEKAISLYRGALLEGCTEQWVYPERQSREQAYLSALERLAKQTLEAGAPATAARYLQRVIAAEGLRESAHCQLMRALADHGDYAALVQTYRDLRLLLYRELHTDPSVETTALFHRLRKEGREVVQARSVVAPPLSSPTARHRHNLPLPLTSFIGRKQEKVEVKLLLGRSRLLTLTGSGGCGKTRLSLMVAAEVLENYTDGVWLVELAGVSNPELVARAVADALSLKEEAGKPVVHTLLTFLKDRRVLLILDNCEHLLASCASLSEALLQQGPRVTVLASSRENLGVGGEQVYRVPSLSLPTLPSPTSSPDKGKSAGGTLQSLMESEAARLFLERARAVQPTFALTPTNALPLAQACIRLEGIPLAIELAAVWVRSLSMEEIHTRLDDRFLLLTGGSRTTLPRHQTLRALIDWSYDLLNNWEKTLFARLSVFTGGWTLEAAEYVCAGEAVNTSLPFPLPQDPDKLRLSPIHSSMFQPDVLDLLTCLVDKSLVMYLPNEKAAGRYRLLETVRQYAGERLAAGGEEKATRSRHRDFFLAFAEEAEPKLTGAEQSVWLERLEKEHENLRAALDTSLSEAVSGEGLRFCDALRRYWMTRGHYAEGREWYVRALGRAEGKQRSPTVAKARNGVGVLAYLQGDYASARAYHEEGLNIFREIGDRQGIALSLNGLGNVAMNQGDFASSRTYHEEGLTILKEIGDGNGIAASLNNLGNVAYSQGDYISARTFYEESLILRREAGDRQGIALAFSNLGSVAYLQGDYASARAYHEQSFSIRREVGERQGIALSLSNLGTVAMNLGDYASARTFYEESLVIFRKIGDRNGIALVLEGFASLAAKESRPEQAAALWAAAGALRQQIGAPVPPNEREAYNHEVAAARQELGEEQFATVWATGSAMSLEQGIAYALENSAH